MPTAAAYARIPGIVTTDFLYVRWLGDRHGIEEITQTWDRLVVDRGRELVAWRDALQSVTGNVARTYAYFNNHFAGCGYQSAFQFEEHVGVSRVSTAALDSLSPGGRGGGPACPRGRRTGWVTRSLFAGHARALEGERNFEPWAEEMAGRWGRAVETFAARWWIGRA